ncbi:MAG: hypothetical protein JNL79_26035 [Myxococcales bacterium]|nr:hypothetical protein [Myxococcales bacterium]
MTIEARPASDEDVYDENGVDRSLIRWFLTLTPVERLAILDDAMQLAELVEARRDPSR